MHMEAPAGEATSSKHIVLVHGGCHGGWSWYKVATRFRSAGYRVSTPDLAASGVDPRPLREVPTFHDYTKPLLDLLESLPAGEKVVIVGHSLGGVNIALASELFPEKVAAAVFLSAFMPDDRSPPSYVLEKFVEGGTLDWMDTEFKPQDPEGQLPISMLFGPLVTRAKLYQLCSPEDLTLGRSLLRVGSMFLDDLRLQQPYTEARYGSVRKVFIVCKDDLAIVEGIGGPSWGRNGLSLPQPMKKLHTIYRISAKGPPLVEGFQRWMVENYAVDEVKEIHGADHMAMLSMPTELAGWLADIAEKYA